MKTQNALLENVKNLLADKSAVDIAMIVHGVSGFKTTILEELTTQQLETLISIYEPKQVPTQENSLIETILKKEWKSNILAKAEKYGIKDKGDFQKFNLWMLQRSMFKKHLNAHSLEELKALHRQICSVGSNNRKASINIGSKSWWKHGDAVKNLN